MAKAMKSAKAAPKPKAKAAKAPVKTSAKPAAKASAKPIAKAAKPLAKKAEKAAKVNIKPPTKEKKVKLAVVEVVAPEIEEVMTETAVEEVAVAAKPEKKVKEKKEKKVREKKPKTPAGPTAEDMAKWADLKEKYAAEKAQSYTLAGQYEPNKPLQHKVLGWGFVMSINNDRLEVIFETGVKTLISNYKPA